MKISGVIYPVLALLVTCALFAGCTGSAPAATTPAQTAVTTTASNTPLYSAGDIVQSPKATNKETGWFILKYESSTDSYERAFIYRNADGTWGYRVDSRTESLGRVPLEKVNTVKVTSVSLDQVAIRQPAAAGTTSPAVNVSATATATSAMKPQFKDVTPDSGVAGTLVAISDIHGNYFQNGARVQLAREGSTAIPATGVTVTSSSHIMCNIQIPANATTGVWDIVITNPDGQLVRYNNIFTIKANPNPVTTTESSSSTGIITGIDPQFAETGGSEKIYRPLITGNNIPAGAMANLKNSNGAVLVGTDPLRQLLSDPLQISFIIPAGSQGEWTLVLLDSNGKVIDTWATPVTIR
jgi:hypothetical protein